MGPLAVYRIQGQDFAFPALGKLEQSSGAYVITCPASLDQVALMDAEKKAGREPKITVEVGNAIVAVMPVYKWRVGKAGRGGLVDLWILVG